MKLQSILLIVVFSILLSNFSYSDWQKTQLPTNNVNTLHVYNNKLFAGTNGNGVFMSGNQGSSWNDVSSDLGNKYVWAIVSSGSSLFCGTDGGGVYLSLTSGSNWKPANDGLGNTNIFNLGIDGSNLFALTDNNGVYRSILGTNWENINDGMIVHNMYAITISDSKVYIGGENGGLYMSTNNGNSWNGLNPGTIVSTINAILIKQNKIFVGTSFGVLVSENQGLIWTRINTGLSNTDITSLILKDNLIIAGTRGGGIFATANDGQSWRSFNEGLDNLNIQCLAIDSKYLYVGTTTSVSRRLLSEIVIPEVLPPILISPANNSTNVPRNVSFTWQASTGAISYHIQISKDQLMQNIIEDVDNLNNLYFEKELESSTTYYWRVAANTDEHIKKWSELWSFTTASNFGPPELISPENLAKGVAVLARFDWKEVPEAVLYKLKIAEDNEFVTGVISIDSIMTNSYTLTEPLKGYTSYYWTVAAVDKYSNTFWSVEIWEFETGEPSNVKEYGKDGKIISIYPSPANDYLILKKSEMLEIKDIVITDILGKRIKEYTNEGHNYENLTIQLDDISTGNYIIQLRTVKNEVFAIPFSVFK